jgi:hypothetical protein
MGVVDRFRNWLSDYALVWCVRCQYLMFRKDAQYVRHVSGVIVPLCADCEHELYHPLEM